MELNNNGLVGEPQPVAPDGANSQPDRATPPSRRKILLFRSVVVIVVLCNVAMLAFNIHQATASNGAPQSKAQPVPKTVTSSEKSKLQKSTASTASAQVTTLHYVSSDKSIEFDYPVDWRLSAGTGQSVDLTSGKIAYKLPNGKQVTGSIVLFVSNDSAVNPVMYSDGTASADSQTIAYTNPASGQRPATNLTYVSVDSSQNQDVPNVFNTLVVTGNKHYQQGGSVTVKDVSNFHPMIGAYINSCQDHCQALSMGEMTPALLQSDPNLSKIQKVIQSMRIN